MTETTTLEDELAPELAALLTPPVRAYLRAVAGMYVEGGDEPTGNEADGESHEAAHNRIWELLGKDEKATANLLVAVVFQDWL